MGAAREYIYYTPEGKRVPAPSYRTSHDVQSVNPRVRMAIRLYATGAAKTKQQACRMAGLSDQYLSLLTSKAGSTEVKNSLQDFTDRLEDETLDMNVVLRRLGRAAVAKIAGLMEDPAAKPEVQLKAAVDLADRSSETSKIQKHAVMGLTIGGEDAKALAAAMVESAQARERFPHVVHDGLIEVDVDTIAPIDSQGAKAAGA